MELVNCKYVKYDFYEWLSVYHCFSFYVVLDQCYC